ncbi:MAG: hypothetical protein R3B72_43070 [Polyangiaceae bacterium]
MRSAWLIPRLLLPGCLAFGLATSIARAEPMEALKDTAKALYEEAKAARERQEWDYCYAKAKAAWGVQRHPKIAAALGDCSLDLGRPREAAEHLRFYLDRQREGGDPAFVAYVEKRYAEAKAQIATVTVTVNDPEAAVFLDEAPIATGKPLFIDPGVHRFVARLGRQEAVRSLTLAPGSESPIELTLSPDDEPPPTPPPPGGDPGSPEYPWLVGIGAGLTAAGLGAAIGLTVAANGKASDVDDLQAAILRDHPGGCSDAIAACGDLDDALKSQETLHNAALGLWIGTGVLALATGAYALFAYPGGTDEEPAVSLLPLHLVPLLGPGYLGLSGAF